MVCRRADGAGELAGEFEVGAAGACGSGSISAGRSGIAEALADRAS
jgi:hypothetical protein